MNILKKLSTTTVLISAMLLLTACEPDRPQAGNGGGVIGAQPGYQPGIVQPLPNGQYQVTFNGQSNYDAVDAWGTGELAGGSTPVVGGLTANQNGTVKACSYGYCWDFLNPLRPTGSVSLGGTGIQPPNQYGYITRTVQGYSKLDPGSTIQMQGISGPVTTSNGNTFRPMSVVGQITLSQTQLAVFGGQMPSVSSVAYNFRFNNGSLQGGGILIYLNGAPSGKNGIFLLF